MTRQPKSDEQRAGSGTTHREKTATEFFRETFEDQNGQVCEQCGGLLGDNPRRRVGTTVLCCSRTCSDQYWGNDEEVRP